MKGKKGFTLVELIIVVVIVGILASAAIPMMRANIEKARKSEAVAALGAIRTAERLFASENAAGNYVSVTSGALANTDSSNPLASYIAGADLNGHFFDVNAYSVTASGNTFTATANCVNSTAPGEADVNTYTAVTMNQDGTIANY